MKKIRTYHIWRYDNDTPAEEQPWIVTILDETNEALEDPPCFATPDEAVAFIASGGVDEW